MMYNSMAPGQDWSLGIDDREVIVKLAAESSGRNPPGKTLPVTGSESCPCRETEALKRRQRVLKPCY